ncbi:hypothetical protein PR048_015137 [Dryococelus australis]|uniref:Uncharacterized protein n=1 Tax=Dryococelus australis TaxID=614101 RepID=A0ABQ9HG95_9NEOP|nr:hypothetical protein PR048_015137 [Dryococelus australis]
MFNITTTDTFIFPLDASLATMVPRQQAEGQPVTLPTLPGLNATGVGCNTARNHALVDAIVAPLGKIMVLSGSHLVPDSRGRQQTGRIVFIRLVILYCQKKRRIPTKVRSETSAERGEMITVTTAISANVNALPPMFVFPRKKFRDHFV